MPLPTSGQIAISNLRSEFGDTPGEDGLNEYYRGGAYVSWNNSNVPTSGQIALSNFYGAQNGYLIQQGATGIFRGYDRGLVGSPAIGSIYQTTWNGIQIYAVRVSYVVIKGITYITHQIFLQGSRARNTFGRYYDTSFGNLYTASSSTYQVISGNTQWTWTRTNVGQYDGSGAIRFYLYP